MYTLRVNIVDNTTPFMKRMAIALQQERLRPIIGRSAAGQYRDRLIEKEADSPNKQGWPRQNFYGTAARATTFEVVTDGVDVIVSRIGIRQRYFGGTIEAGKGVSSFTGGPTSYLTIPARAEAYGRKAGDFALQIIFGRGRRPVGLALASSEIKIKKTKKGGLKVSKGALHGGLMMYWLVKSVTQEADESVLPHIDDVLLEVKRAVKEFLARQAQGGG